MRGLLVRRIPVQLVDLSLSGCLFQATERIRPGAAGELEVTVRGAEYRDAVNVVRASERRGSHLMSMGGEFTWRSGPVPKPTARGLQTIVPPRPRRV